LAWRLSITMEARSASKRWSNIPTVNNRRCLDEAFRLLQEKSAPAVAVVDAFERLVGLVTSETIGRYADAVLVMASATRAWGPRSFSARMRSLRASKPAGVADLEPLGSG
jgi:CBS-domain-containing membrane protein